MNDPLLMSFAAAAAFAIGGAVVVFVLRLLWIIISGIAGLFKKTSYTVYTDDSQSLTRRVSGQTVWIGNSWTEDISQQPAVTGHFASDRERDESYRRFEADKLISRLGRELDPNGEFLSGGGFEDKHGWWDKPSIRRIDDTQPPDPPKKNDGDLRDLNDDDWRRMGLK